MNKKSLIYIKKIQKDRSIHNEFYDIIFPISKLLDIKNEYSGNYPFRRHSPTENASTCSRNFLKVIL